MCVDCYRNDDDYAVLTERPVLERMEAHRDGVTPDEYEQMLAAASEAAS
jgi:hypothetical protein